MSEDNAIGDWTLDVVEGNNRWNPYSCHHEWSRENAPETKIRVDSDGIRLGATGTPFRSLAAAQEYADCVLVAQGKLKPYDAIEECFPITGSVTTYDGGDA